MKAARDIRFVFFVYLVLTVAAGAGLAGEQPRALVFAWNDDGATTAALREAGMDAVQAPRPPLPESSGPLALDDVRLVVLSADLPLPDDLAARIAAFVRAGGGMLALHTSDDPNYWWNTYRRTGAGPPHPSPLWDALPFVSVPMADQSGQGIRNPFGPTRVLRQADSPLLAGVDLTQAPPFPYHGFMVLPTHPIVQGAHVMFAWSEDQYKSPLWGNGQALAWGDDPEQRPLLLTAQYGAGRCVGVAAPLFDKAFLQWPGSQALVKNLTAWLAGEAQPTAPVATTQSLVYGVGLPWIVRDSLQRMGLAVTEQPEGATGAIVYGAPTAEQAQAVAQLARANKPVVVANPAALRVAPLDELAPLGQASASAQADASHAAKAPRTVIDAKSLWGNRKLLRDSAWAFDPDNVGQDKQWFTPEGAAAVQWQDGIPGADSGAGLEKKTKQPARAKQGAAAGRGGARGQRKQPAETKQGDIAGLDSGPLQGPPAGANEPQPMASWSETYRWRLEGSLLDRRDLIEGWEQPAFNDSAWTEQAMGQPPPPPQVAGVAPPAQNLLAGAVWARARLTLTHPEASRGWLAPSTDPKFVTLLDGKPLRQPAALRTLAVGEHMVALRAWPLQRGAGRASENPWGSQAEPLQWPEIVDSPWLHRAADKGEADGFFAGYHSDWLSGDPTQEKPPHGGPGWYQIRLDAQPNRTLLEISGGPGEGAATLVWLDGKPLGAAPQVIDLPRLTPGSHVLTLLKGNAGALSIRARANLWFKATVSLPDDAKWNALQIDDASDAVLYVNGQQAASGATGVVRVPWKTGDNLLVFGNLDRQTLPSCRLAQAPTEPAAEDAPDAQRLQGVWYRRGDPDHQALAQGWPAALTDAAPPEGWIPITPDPGQGSVASVSDERPRWFAAPFQATPSEAAGPARLVIDTTGDAVPNDLIKNVWVNGQRVAARIEFASTQRYELDRGKQTTISFILSGRLKAGCNWLAFPVDFQEHYRLRLAAPSEGGRWLVPLPKLDFSGNLDAVVWSEPLGRLNGGGLVRRGQTVTPPAGATVLARFSDGVPAVARVGSITFATSDQSRDWSRWIEEAVRYDWVVLKNGGIHDGPGMQLKSRNHASGDPAPADGAQVAASLLRGAPAILGAEPGADGGAVALLAPAKEPRLLSYQYRNWMGMVLSEGRLAVPAGATRVAAPAPEFDPSPMTTRLRGDHWLRVALLDGDGAAVSDYLEARVDARPAVEMLLSPTDGSKRDLPAVIPGAPDYDPFNRNWSLAADSPANPVVVPGERIELRAMCRNTTAQPQQVALDLTWEGALETKSVALRALRFTLAPYEQRTELLPCGFRVSDMSFTALSGDDPAPLRAMPEGRQPEGALATGRVVARAGNAVASELALIAVRPWKQFAPNATHRPPGQCGAPGGFDMAQFDKTASLESLADPKARRFWGSELSGNWCSAMDWWRDYFMNTRGNGGGFDGFNGKKDFAWGPFDDVYDKASPALDNASYLPNGTQYQEMLYASISREYNRFLRGTQPLLMSVADFWANFSLAGRERNDVQFLRWRRDQGRPLNVATAAELADRRQNDPAVAEDWRKFSEDAYVAWSRQFMAGLPPGSINFSQGESMHFLFQRLHDNLDAIRAVLSANNSAVFQPMDVGRRGELHFGWMRAMAPDLLLRSDFWFHTVGNSQTLGHSFGSGGSVLTTPDLSRLSTLDNGLMAIRDDAGRIQPLVNVPINEDYLPERSRIPLFAGAKFKGGKGSLPAELLGRDVTYHVCSLIQPERLLGYYVVTTLERVAEDKLDGMVVNLGARTDQQPIMALTHMLRNYGALWGGVIAPDRTDKLQPGEGALYLMPSGAGDAEAQSLVDLVRRGGCASIFFSTGGTKTHETALSDLFGVKYSPLPADVQGGMVLPDKTERPLPQSADNLPQYVATRPGKDEIQGSGGLSGRTLLRDVEAGKGRAIFSSLNCDSNWGWDHDLARQLAKAVNWAAGNPVTLPEGVGGYAFEAKGMTFLALEDLKYTGGPAAIHVKLPAGKYLAADLFSGLPVKVEPREDGVMLYPTLPPNGGSVIVARKIEPR
ncbi:MAG: hypothetical protein NTW86_00565 [Candidatus Sumerlaeota bacterium]|nr:hypothetical protein [Candidatus Sumerlaeota bacterium]